MSNGLAANKRTGDAFANRAAFYDQINSAVGRWSAAIARVYDPMRWRGSVPWWRRNPT